MNRPITRSILATALTAALTVSAFAAANQPYRVAIAPSASAEFNFRVTLIPVPGRVNAVTAKLNLDPQRLEQTTGTVSVNLAKLDTGIGLRDEHARGYLGADKHPNAVFTLSRVSGITRLEVGKAIKGTVIGSFNLNGISTPLSAPITLELTGKRVKVSTAFNVILGDHKISIPGADAAVDVKVNFSLEPNIR